MSIQQAVAQDMLWRMLLPQAFAVLPFGMVAAFYFKAASTQLQEQVYLYVNLVDVGCSLVSFVLSAFIGEMSQPERLGRKTVLVYLAVVDSLPIAALHLTQNYRLFLVVRFTAAFIGAQMPNFAAIAVINSWITDWATPDQKISLNAKLMGALFGLFAVSPLLGAGLSFAGCSMTNLLYLTAALKLLHPLFLLLVFPNTQATELAAQRNRCETPAALSSTGPLKARDVTRRSAFSMQRVVGAWKYLAHWHPKVLLITCISATVGKGFQKNLPLYLTKELGANPATLNTSIGISSLVTLLLQWYVVPWHSRLPGSSSNIWILLVTVAEFGHILVIAGSRSLAPVLAASWLQALAATTDPVLTSAVSRCSNIQKTSGVEDPGADQGLILGSLTGLKTLCSCGGPLIMTALLHITSPQKSFVVLALLMCPALMVAIQLYFESKHMDNPWESEYNGLRKTMVQGKEHTV